MNTLPIEPTERDRERFRDITKAMGFALEYNRRLAANGDYTDLQTVSIFKIWWAVERERQLLQNLNMSQGCKLSELAQELESERKRLDWALERSATFYEWQGRHYLSYDVPENDGFDVIGFDVIESTDPRATIDELIAAEAAGDMK